jgi:hypothetical protein
MNKKKEGKPSSFFKLREYGNTPKIQNGCSIKEYAY